MQLTKSYRHRMMIQIMRKFNISTSLTYRKVDGICLTLKSEFRFDTPKPVSGPGYLLTVLLATMVTTSLMFSYFEAFFMSSLATSSPCRSQIARTSGSSIDSRSST